MPPDFLTPERKKYNFLEKFIQKKIQKSFIVYNNNNNLQVHSLQVHNKSDHWRNKQNNIEYLSLNIVPCFAIK